MADTDPYLIALLERIAFNTDQYHYLDFEHYIQELKDACNKRSSEAILRYVRAQPATREGEVPQHEPRKDARLRGDAGKRPPQAKK